METERIIRLMENAGFKILGADSQYVYIEEPSCILRGFVSFAEYAWIALACVTVLLLFGWAISMIRGSKNDMFTNMRNLILIFCAMSAAGPAVNAIFGEDLFARGCKTEKLSIAEITELLKMRDARLSSYDENEQFELLDIYDSGAPSDELSPISETPDPDIPPSDSAQTPDPGPSPTNPDQPIKAHGNGTHTLYTYADRSKIRRESGSPAWRNNNPGNIVSGNFIKRAGGIGESGRFGVFPDEQTGMDAIIKLLKTENYQNRTLGQAISAWAPPSDGNNTSSYQNQVAKALGVSLNTPMRNLSDDQLRTMANMIRRIEGWIPGTETKE